MGQGAPGEDATGEGREGLNGMGGKVRGRGEGIGKEREAAKGKERSKEKERENNV